MILALLSWRDIVDAPDVLWLFSVATARDWVIIFMGIAVAAFFFIGLILMIIIGLLTRSLLTNVNSAVEESVKPLLANAKETTQQVKGTATYVSNTAVKPIIRTAGVVAGARRAAAILAGLTGAGGDKPKE